MSLLPPLPESPLSPAGVSAKIVKRHYVAIASDGTKLTRRSARSYSHAVLVWSHSWRDRANKWSALGFMESAALAVEAVSARQKYLKADERVELVEAHEFIPITDRQRAFLDHLGDKTVEMFGTGDIVGLAKRGLVERRFLGQRWWRVRRTEAGRRALEISAVL